MSVLVASFSPPADDLLALAGGAGEVSVVSLPHPATSVALAEALVACVREVDAQVVVLPSGRASAEVAALLAHQLGAALIVDAARLETSGGEVRASKRVLGGTWDVVCAASGPVVVLGQPAPASGEVPQTRSVDLPEGLATAQHDVELLSSQPVAADGIALGDAAVVVAGGRGLEETSVRFASWLTRSAARWGPLGTSLRRTGSVRRRWSVRPAR